MRTLRADRIAGYGRVRLFRTVDFHSDVAEEIADRPVVHIDGNRRLYAVPIRFDGGNRDLKREREEVSDGGLGDSDSRFTARRLARFLQLTARSSTAR